jgi:hypothetical protein
MGMSAPRCRAAEQSWARSPPRCRARAHRERPADCQHELRAVQQQARQGGRAEGPQHARRRGAHCAREGRAGTAIPRARRMRLPALAVRSQRSQKNVRHLPHPFEIQSAPWSQGALWSLVQCQSMREGRAVPWPRAHLRGGACAARRPLPPVQRRGPARRGRSQLPRCARPAAPSPPLRTPADKHSTGSQSALQLTAGCDRHAGRCLVPELLLSGLASLPPGKPPPAARRAGWELRS